MTDNEIWAAGLMSASGSFLLVKTGSKQDLAVRFVIRSSLHHESIERFAQIAEANAKEVRNPNGSLAKYVALQGKPLHRLMTRVWAELPTSRKREYAKLRKQLPVNPWSEKPE